MGRYTGREPGGLKNDARPELLGELELHPSSTSVAFPTALEPNPHATRDGLPTPPIARATRARLHLRGLSSHEAGDDLLGFFVRVPVVDEPALRIGMRSALGSLVQTVNFREEKTRWGTLWLRCNLLA